MSETELCGDFRGEDGWFGAECQLPKDHGGDEHWAVVTWPKVEWVKSEPTPMSEAIEKIWAPEIERQLRAVASFKEFGRG